MLGIFRHKIVFEFICLNLRVAILQQMKKTILIAYSLLVVVSTSAQFSFGIKTGAGLSNTPYDGLEFKVRPSFNGGVYFQHQTHKKIHF